MLIHRVIIDDAQKAGELTRERWAELTADQVGTINTAHPFNEGNGRTMRRFVELSAEHYGFRARIIGGPEWMAASHNAMIPGHPDELRNLIIDNSMSTESEDRRSKATEDNVMAEAAPKSAAVTSAAAEAVAKIKDPQRRAEAQQLLDGMRSAAAQQQRQDKSAERPMVDRPGGGGDRGGDLDR